MGKPQWMTETSGYQDAWNGTPGAFSLGVDIMSGLNNGNMSGWVWWQGSENPGSANVGDFALMNGSVKGKKYYVSKQFYRYIRPGAVRVGATSTNANVFVSAYEHTGQGTHTIVLANTSTTTQNVTVGGAGLPATFTIFRTSATDNAADVGTYTAGTTLEPARPVHRDPAGRRHAAGDTVGGIPDPSASTEAIEIPERQQRSRAMERKRSAREELTGSEQLRGLADKAFYSDVMPSWVLNGDVLIEILSPQFSPDKTKAVFLSRLQEGAVAAVGERRSHLLRIVRLIFVVVELAACHQL